MDNEASSQDLVDHLNDERVLHSYCTFNTMFRPLVAAMLNAQRSDDEVHRRAVALEIASCWVAAIEDLVMWVLVLREWRPGTNLLFDLLDSTAVVENDGPRSTVAVLQSLSERTIDEFREDFGLPTEAELVEQGYAPEYAGAQRHALEGFVGLLRDALPIRTSNENVVVTSYNKIKHGVLAVRSSMNSRIGQSFLLASRKGPLNPETNKRKINATWLPCEDEELAKMMFDTLVVSEALFILLNWIYTTRFDRSWLAPPWPPDLVALLDQFRILNEPR